VERLKIIAAEAGMTVEKEKNIEAEAEMTVVTSRQRLHTREPKKERKTATVIAMRIAAARTRMWRRDTAGPVSWR